MDCPELAGRLHGVKGPGFKHLAILKHMWLPCSRSLMAHVTSGGPVPTSAFHVQNEGREGEGAKHMCQLSLKDVRTLAPNTPAHISLAILSHVAY